MLLEHSGQFCPKRIGQRKDARHLRAVFATGQRLQQAERRERNLLLALKMRMQDFRELPRCIADRSREPGSCYQSFMDLVMLRL